MNRLKRPIPVSGSPPAPPTCARRLTFNPGRALTPPLPGGVFALSDLASPAEGNRILRLTFPAASTRTVVMATVSARSRYQVGLAIERWVFRSIVTSDSGLS